MFFNLVLLLDPTWPDPDDIVYADVNPLPTFSAGVSNLTVTSGRNAQLTCKVENLGNYKVMFSPPEMQRTNFCCYDPAEIETNTTMTQDFSVPI